MPDAIPALTIWQPWATLIIEGLKPYEFRRWAAPRHLWGRRIAIHAGARAPKRAEVLDLIHRLQMDAADGQALDEPGSLRLLLAVVNNLAALPLSSVLGTAVLGQPLTPEQVRRQLANDSDRDDGLRDGGRPPPRGERLRRAAPRRVSARRDLTGHCRTCLGARTAPSSTGISRSHAAHTTAAT